MVEIKWPRNFKSAAMLTFDMDGETTWENGNKSFPNGKEYIKSISVGQYGPKRAVAMILDMLDKYNVKGTFFIPGLTAERYPDVVRMVDRAGHEIGHHGYAHERFASKTVAEQITIIEKAQKIYTDILGHPVAGFRTPSGDWSIETPSLLNERGFSYTSSMRGDDIPYHTVIDGKETNLIEMPTKWELDDYVQMAYSLYPGKPAGQDRIMSYRLVLDNFIKEFEGSHKLGLLIVFMFHPQIIGSPGQIQILEKLLKHLTEKKDLWIAQGHEIATWYKEAYPIKSNNLE